MGKTLIGKIIYYWIFVLGGGFFAYLLGYPINEGFEIIKLLAILSLVYWGLAFLKMAGEKKRAERGEKGGKK
ncbi:MAG: hypothetical protein ACRCUS_01610 [Anaerovoracaceae bacterium]